MKRTAFYTSICIALITILTSNNVFAQIIEGDRSFLMYWHDRVNFGNCPSIGIADIDGDNLGDIVFRYGNENITAIYDQTKWTSIWELINEGDVPVNTDPDGWYARFLIGDFNGDGHDDLLFKESSPPSKLKRFDGATLTWSVFGNTSYSISQLRVGDFDGDGMDDLFTSSGGKWWVSFSASPGWVQVNTSGVTVNNLLVGDFDGNGIDDIFTSSGGYWRISWFATSSWVTVANSSITVNDLMVGDFNGDGPDDVLHIANNKLRYYMFDDPSWITIATLGRAYEKNEIYIGQLNNYLADDILIVDNSLWECNTGGGD